MSLSELGRKYGTDKLTHGFLKIYEEYFSALKDKKINLLEIGVFHGASIKMWDEYFSQGQIHGIDAFEGKQGNGSVFINFRAFLDEVKGNPDKYPKVFLHQVDQSKQEQLDTFVQYCRDNHISFDIIIDDGSHLMFDQQISMSTLMPLMNLGGIYVMEDLHTSFQRDYDVLPDKSNTTAKVLETLKTTGVFLSIYTDEQDWSNIVERVDFHQTEKQSKTAIIVKKKAEKFLIVTGASKNHHKSLRQFIATLYDGNSDFALTVYDLGLHDARPTIEELQKEYPFELQTFDYSKYPDYFNIEIAAGEYAWKPVIIEDALNRWNPSLLLWCDSGNIIKPETLPKYQELLSKVEIYSPFSAGNIRKWTYPSVIELFNARGIENRQMRNGAIMGFNTSKENVRYFIKDFSQKAQIREFIAPEASNRTNHRQDQSLFTLLYYNFTHGSTVEEDTKSFEMSIHRDCD